MSYRFSEVPVAAYFWESTPGDVILVDMSEMDSERNELSDAVEETSAAGGTSDSLPKGDIESGEAHLETPVLKEESSLIDSSQSDRLAEIEKEAGEAKSALPGLFKKVGKIMIFGTVFGCLLMLFSVIALVSVLKYFISANLPH